MTITFLLLSSLLVPVQDGSQDPAGSAAPAAPAAETGSVNAADLKGRIHEMRMNLLTGGPNVRQAEAEAIDFYGNKEELIARRLDTIAAELSEKRASYELALDRALEGDSAERRQSSMAEANSLRTEISSLEVESTALERKRTDLAKMISAVESRDRERERLVTQLETNDGFEYSLDMPLASIGLAPALPPGPAASPLANSALVEDLLARDPRAARTLLYESDPVGYWERFPLRPPTDVISRSLDFPMPDLPGQR